MWEKVKRAGDEFLQPFDLGVTAVEEGEEAGLRSGRALDPAKAQALDPRLHLFEVAQQVVAPQGGAFADGGELGGLVMGKSQSG
jgi:hypothetical protein